ncbi:putative glycerophosphoryl diester phosphodiesterase 1 [Corynebacterium kalinowskii]|uniref:Glycerophosphoryl diester phosphodiesterase 1 n=1 Tax=Corynebacterium kalinowskii TaxID=2675216 RepID=A0A6B8W0L2_9CORY|nr:glycerophosphodiester phosphodiesterase family protein [Corynebacterium kalinowskii]QGU03150.1 putative glycerophosphoryl diester phosphodiesterase 1 [Corynebacterium kalinowskii]
MQIIAHRGDSGAHPELTQIAFESALALGAPAVECDVRLTRDGQLVCVHDSNIERVSNGTGRVENMHYAQLREFNFGTAESPQEPLLLDSLLELMQEYPDRHLYIEAKHPSRYGKMVEEQIVVRLRYAGLLDDPRMHFISFAPLAIRNIQNLAPQLDRILLRDDKPSLSWKTAARWCQPMGLGMSIEAAKANPAELQEYERTYLWTVDDPADMLWAQEHGVDMLATNYPELALRTVS